MSPTLTTFLFEAANFLVLAIVLGWLFFKPVRQALADRRVKFAAESEQAAEKLAAAEKTQQEMEAARADLQDGVDMICVRRELETARQQAEQILTDARGAAERERELSRRQAARMSETQRDRLAEAAVTAAADTVGHLFEQIDGPELQSALINAACRQLASLPRGDLAPVKIESAEPLSHEQQATLEERARRLGRNVRTSGPSRRLGGRCSHRDARRPDRRDGQRTDSVCSSIASR